MRIMLVEDEPKTREGLKNIMERFTEHKICGVATDGLEGLKLISELKPDLIISDVCMPNMDGLTMLRQLEERGQEYPALILTGYSSFEYAREALKLGAVNYILKPIDVESFLKTLEETEKKIYKEKSRSMNVEQGIWNLLTCADEQKEEYAAQLMKKLPYTNDREITLYLIKPFNTSRETSREMCHCIKKKLSEQGVDGAYVLPISISEGILIMFADSKRYGNIHTLFEVHVLPALSEIGYFCCSTASFTDIEKFDTAMSELKEIMTYSFYTGENVVLDKKMISAMEFAPVFYPIDLENRIRKEILSGDYDKALHTSEKFKNTVIESKGKPDLIREYIAQFSSRVYDAAHEYGGEEEPMLIFHYFINNIIESKTKNELIMNFNKIMASILKKEREYVDIDNLVVLKVVNYIRNNYEKNITLTDAATLVGVTPEYLSKLFNQTIGVNFVAFLRNFRISEAKRMLLSGKYRVQDVAFRVGFRDMKYFYKVFKLVCGVSPSEYKKVVR